MKFLNAFFLLGLFFSIAFPGVLHAQKYVQVWGDEFNEPGLPDSTKWDYEVGYKRNSELQYYTRERLKNARIEDTVLVIEAHKEYYGGMNYTSASLISRGVGDWRYGKIEVRAMVPAGKGTWPAVWMMPTYSEYGSWPRSGEIDIMEYIGVEPDKLHFYAHFEGTGGTGHESTGRNITFAQPYNRFIKFTLIWTPEKLEWYADDVKYHTYTKASDDYRVWPFDREFYLILNLAYGGEWGGYDGVDDSKLPHQFLIDYVRVYRLQEHEGPFSLDIKETEGGTVLTDPELDSYPEGTEVTLTAIPEDGYAFKAWKHFSGANPYTFTINRDIEIVPLFDNPYELIENGSFDISRVPWEFYVSNPQTASYLASVEDGVFTVNVTRSPGVDWQLGFQQLGFAMKKGEYRLKFDAWSGQQKQLLVSVSKNYPDWGEIVGRRLTISTQPQSYEITFDMPRDDNNVRLYFGLGNFTGKFHIDNISLMRTEDIQTSAGPEIKNQPDVSVFPNPAYDTFTLKIPENWLHERPVVEIHTPDGRKVFGQRLQQSLTSIPTSATGTGSFTVTVYTSSDRVVTRLIIR